MRIQHVVSACLAVFAFGCGGDDGGSDGGDDDGGADAAAPSALGKACMTSANCDAAAPICVTLEGNSWCSASCGTTNEPPMGMMPMPPSTGQAACATAGAGNPGSPICALSTPPSMGMINWACGIACGDFMGTALGTCPSNMTCDTATNFCE